MTSKLPHAAALLVAAAVAWGQSGSVALSGGQEGCEANHQSALLTEVRKLRTELLESRIDAQTARVVALEQALAQIELQRARLAEDERNAPQQLASLDARFQGQTLTAEQRAELESAKAMLLATQGERSNAERSSLQAREADTSASLRLEQQRLQAAKARLNELTSSAIAPL